MTYVPNINVVRYFIKVAELKNITKAAEELYISQPTLSRQIAAFEENIGIQLISRTKNGILLTDKGKIVCGECQKLVAAHDRFASKIADIKGEVYGSLNIGYQMPSKEFIALFNSRLLSFYPHITINSMRQTKENFTSDLLDGSLDLAYMYGHELKNESAEIKSVRIHTWKKMLMVSRNHPLAKRESVDLRELADENFIHINREISPVKYEEFLTACRDNGFFPNVVKVCDNFYDALIDVISYNAVTIMPDWNETGPLLSQVTFIGLTGLDDDYPVHLAWYADNKNPAVPLYVGQVMHALEEDDFLEK